MWNRQPNQENYQSLDGVWDFVFLGNRPLESIQINALTFDDKLSVPSAFDAMPRYAGERGFAAYRCHIH